MAGRFICSPPVCVCNHSRLKTRCRDTFFLTQALLDLWRWENGADTFSETHQSRFLSSADSRNSDRISILQKYSLNTTWGFGGALASVAEL